MPERETLAQTLTRKHADVNEREIALFEHLWRAWPYIPANLIDLESGTSVRQILNNWIEETYGLRFTEPHRSKPGGKRKRSDRSVSSTKGEA